MRASRAVYDALQAAVRGLPLPDDRAAAAAAAPLRCWERALWIERCTPFIYRLWREGDRLKGLPAPLGSIMEQGTRRAAVHGLQALAQLNEIAALAASAGIPVMALKGAARLLGGDAPGLRSIADLDLLVEPAAAARLHQLLRSELGYKIVGAGRRHHLSPLGRPDSLPVDLHTSAGAPDGCAGETWHDAREIRLAGGRIFLPAPTQMLLHVTAHAVELDWALQFRLRDVLDVAACWSDGVNRDEVLAAVSCTPYERLAHTLLSAAHELNPRVPLLSVAPWRQVTRVGRSRLAAASVPGAGAAQRAARWVSIVATGSPMLFGRLLRGLPVNAVRSLRALREAEGHATVRHSVPVGTGSAAPAVGPAAGALAGLLVMFASGCLESAAPGLPIAPPFYFVSDDQGVAQIFRHQDGSVAKLSSSGASETDPHSASGRVVYTSFRHGAPEIYIANADLGAERRLTNDPAFDREAALDPPARRVAFVSGRSGTPRIWLVDAEGGTPVPLTTGSPSFVPEQTPAWSPSGDRIAFTSVRTGTTQVWLVPAAGGEAAQVTHEAGGALDPAWAGPNTIVYTGAVGTPKLRGVNLNTGESWTIDPLTDAPSGGASCSGALCIGTRTTSDGIAAIILFDARGGVFSVVIDRGANDRAPAIVR